MRIKTVTPCIGLSLKIRGFVPCPANDEGMVPITDCFGCECYDMKKSDPVHISCTWTDDNRNLRDVIQNKDNIIAAVIRGPRGDEIRVYGGAVIAPHDRAGDL